MGKYRLKLQRKEFVQGNTIGYPVGKIDLEEEEYANRKQNRRRIQVHAPGTQGLHIPYHTQYAILGTHSLDPDEKSFVVSRQTITTGPKYDHSNRYQDFSQIIFAPADKWRKDMPYFPLSFFFFLVIMCPLKTSEKSFA